MCVLAFRGGKSVAIWQPSCQKVFEESERLFVFLETGHVFYPFFQNITKKHLRFKLNVFEGTFIFRKHVILWTLSNPKIHLWTKINFFHESFRSNPLVTRNTFDFFHL